MDSRNQEFELQRAFGRVVYSLAKIDGEVQQIEKDVFDEVIASHEWAQQVSISFTEETKLDEDPNLVFLKAMKVFRAYGPSKHYEFFIDLLERIAEAHDGIIPEERKMIDRFKETLLNRGNS